MFSRRARADLINNFEDIKDFRSMLSTNVGGAIDNYGQVIVLDDNGINRLGVDLVELIECFIQTVLAAIAVDKMACKLMETGKFDHKLFLELDADCKLCDELKTFNVN
jgi:hypothetical protein